MKTKRFIATLLSVIMVVSLCYGYTTPLTLASEESENPQKLIFNAYDDFSADDNPNLPWKYQYRVMEDGSYVYYDLAKDTREGVVNTWNTNDYAAIAKTQGDLVTSTTNDVLSLSPWTDTHQAVLTFVAPYSGKIHISMTNGGVFAPYSPETGVSFWLLQNEEIKVSKTDLGYDDGYNNRFFAGTETLTVEEGDIIRFVIGRNAAIDGRSYFNPEIQYTQIEDGKVLFNGYDDFSADNNPNMPWKYQYRVMEDGSYVYYDLAKDTREGVINTWNTNDYAAIAKTQGDLVTSTTNDVLNLSPWTDTHQAVLTFVAPYSGKIHISMTNGGVFAPYSPETGVSFWLLQNEEIKVSKTDLGYDDGYNNRFFAGTETLTVEEGDIIRFVIGRNAAIDGRTYFNPKIGYATIIKDSTTDDSNTEDDFIYNAYNDFSADSNPNGVWNYQYRVSENGSYVYKNLDKDSTAENTWQTANLAVVAKTQGDMVTSTTNDVLNLAAWNETHQAVLSFTAPYDGIIDISMTNGGVFAPYNSADGVSFWLLQNDVVRLSKTNLDADYNAEGNRFFAGTETLSVKTGDVIRFVVGRNTPIDGRTYFNPEIRYKELGSDVLSFPSDGEIVVSDIKTNGFTITWPSAVGGSGNYTYHVYCSKTPFSCIPSEGGIKVTGNSYTFKNLTFRESYYVAVVVDDGENRIALNAVDAVKVFSDMFVFDAYQDFSTGSQNAAWQYLYTPIGKLQTTALEWNNTQWGDEVLGSVTVVEKDPVVGTEALCVTPGVDTDVVVAFVAPYTGTIKVSSANGGIYVPANGAGDNYDGINFAMQLNNTVKAQFEAVSAKHMHPSSVDASLFVGRVFTDDYVMKVTEGDVLYFIVNKNTNLHNDNTYFNPIVEYTDVDASTLGLHFGGRKKITATNVTKSTLTVNWPAAFGGTGEYSYTLYISDKAITTIPTKGGIKMSEKTSYEMKELSPYTSYYFAVVASDGKDSVSLISKEAISTIGNTYTFDAVEDYTNNMQPISTPWRYYWQDTKTGKLTELEWNSEKKQYGSDLTTSLSLVKSDMVTGKAALMVHPQMGKDVVLGFIAPFSGKITIDMSNGGVFAPYNGQAQNWDGVNFTLKQNDKVVYNKGPITANNSHIDRCFASGVSLEVKEGDVIYFIVNCNKDAAADATYLAPKVNYTFVEKNSDQFGFLPGATVKATNVENSSFTLNWSSAFSPNKEAISYKVWISTQPIKKQPTSKPIYSGKNLSTVCTGLKFATKYYAYVVATTTSGSTDVLNPDIAVVTACPVYDAYKQYSKETNEAQVWNYAIRTYNEETETYEYTLLEYDEKSKSWGNSEIGMLSTVDQNPVTGLPSMYAHPGANNSDAALVFTAPYSGTIRISMNNGGVFAPHNGKEQNYDGISFFAYSSEKELWTLGEVSSKNNAEGTRLGQNTVEITVKQGDRLYFVVHANKNSAADSTYFNPFIEYVEVTGGTGVVDKLTGFVIPEPEKVYPASFRENKVSESDGLAVALEQLSASVPVWMWIAIYCAGMLALLVAIIICLKKLKNKK